MQKILMIVNPKAGKAKSKKYIENILINLRNSGCTVDLEITTPERNATKIIEEYNLKGKKLIVWGGDGTLNETLRGLKNSEQEAEIAFIPKGTTNDFGHSLNVSFDELAVSKHINNYIVKDIDMGTIDDEPFNYVVSFGLFSKASYQTSRKWKNRVGKPAYYINGFKELFDIKAKTHKIKMTVDGEVIEDEFIYGSVSNSRYMGGFPVFRKEIVNLNDGKFEVLLAKRPKNIFSTFALVIKMLTGNIKDEHITFIQGSKIEVEFPEEEVDLSIDGEYGGKRKKFKIINHQKKTKYLVP